MIIFSTPNLQLHQSGFLTLHSMPDAHVFDSEECGFIVHPIWPLTLGAEPAWFGSECDQLIEWWEEELHQEEQDARVERALWDAEYMATCIGRPL